MYMYTVPFASRDLYSSVHTGLTGEVLYQWPMDSINVMVLLNLLNCINTIENGLRGKKNIIRSLKDMYMQIFLTDIFSQVFLLTLILKFFYLPH